MSFEIEGKLIEKFEEVQVSDSFKKREFVIETEDNAGGSVYTENIKFQLIQAKCDTLSPFSVGDSIKVHFNIKGKKWEKDGKTSYFVNLDAWKIDQGIQESSYALPPSRPSTYSEAETLEQKDHLPF